MTHHVLLAVAAVALILPNNGSDALSSANNNVFVSKGSVGNGWGRSHPMLSSQQSRPGQLSLRAVVEDTLTSEAAPEADETREGTDIPTSTGVTPTVTVIAGPGARITSVSDGVAVEQAFWESSFDQADPGNRFGPESFPTPNTNEEKLVVEFDQLKFPDQLFEGEDVHVNNEPIASEIIKNESENTKQTDSNVDEPDGSETQGTEETHSERDSASNDDPDDSTIRSTMAKSALLHRAGIAGSARKSRSNGRSSRARTHVNKNRRGSSGVGAMGRVLGTVRTAAAAAAAEKKKAEGKENNGNGNDSLNANLSLTGKNVSSKWISAVQSTVEDMLRKQDADIQQQSVDVMAYAESADSPPPGTTSIGLLGEVVQDSIPAIPPLPGTFLVRTNGEVRNRPHVSIRSSVPHSSDDKHIANLRLSVFSRFDEEQQRIFRSRSVEVLNVRRRRGAVVLVAEVTNEGSCRGERPYLNEMQARIASGHQYGQTHGQSAAHVPEPPSPSLTVTSVRGAKVTSVSSGVVVDERSITATDGGSIIGSVECSHQEFRGTMLGASRPKGSLLYVTEVAVRTDARRCGAGAALMKGVDEVAALRGVETIYLHVDVTNLAACAMYEKAGYHYLDKREPIYAQFTASLNLHDGAMHGRKHYLMCKNRTSKTSWLDDDDLFTSKGALGLLG